jgi:glycosyltransferase involved in cell wall biosynthesis
MRIDLFVHSSDRQSALGQLANSDLSEERKQQTRVISIEDVIARRVPAPQLKAWFNPLPATTTTSTQEGIELSQAVRQSSGSVYPVTILTHGLSYHHLLYDYYLRVLLEGTYGCDSILCTSHSSRDAVNKMIAHIEEEFQRSVGAPIKYRGRVDVIPLCVDTARFATHDRTRARALLKLPRESFLILTLGRISPLKADLYPFLPLIKSLADRNPSRQLLWVVAGTEDEGYARLLQRHGCALGLDKQMKFMLDIADDTKALLMQAADVFTSPTDCVTESFGITVIEAMASGVPQVVPDWDGFRDTVRHGETGFLAPTRWMGCCDDLEDTGPICGLLFDQFSIGQSVAVDMRKMENYIHLLINNETLRREMAEQSRKRASTHYSFKAVTRQYDALWCELGEIADAIVAPREAPRFARSRYYHFFGHYASEALSDETFLEITSAGREIGQAENFVPAPPPFLSEFHILDRDVLREALELLVDSHLSPAKSDVKEEVPNRLRVRSLVKSLGKKSLLPPDHLRRHILWLLKYGFIATPGDQELEH